MTKEQFVQLAGYAGILAGLLMTAIVLVTWLEPFWMSAYRDSVSMLFFLTPFSLTVIALTGNVYAKDAPGSSTSALLAVTSVLLSLISMPLLIFGASFDWFVLILGLYTLLLACIAGAVHAFGVRRRARGPAVLLMLSSLLVPFTNTIDARIWLFLPFALAWVLFGTTLTSPAHEDAEGNLDAIPPSAEHNTA